MESACPKYTATEGADVPEDPRELEAFILRPNSSSKSNSVLFGRFENTTCSRRLGVMVLIITAVVIVGRPMVARSRMTQLHNSDSAMATQVPEPGFGRCEEVIAGLRAQVAGLMKSRVAYGEMYCQQHDIGPTGGYCIKTAQKDGDNNKLDHSVCSKMAQLFAGLRVLDVGCGFGQYGKCLNETDPTIYWTGIDGSEGIESATSRYSHELYGEPLISFTVIVLSSLIELIRLPDAVPPVCPDGYVKWGDLSIPQYLDTTYDWVMSVEVGEHIPHEFEDIFFGNIVRHAKKGVFLTWAIEGQGGTHHVNCHNNDYIIRRMAEFGFTYDEETSQDIRESAELSWLQNTVMVFLRKLM